MQVDVAGLVSSGVALSTPASAAKFIIVAARAGFKVYLTAKAYERLAGYLERLGVKLRPFEGEIEGDRYVLVRHAGVVYEVEVYFEGRREVRKINASSFEAALRSLAESLGAPEAPEPEYYMVEEVPEDVAEELLELLMGERDGGEERR